jgi:hypothetical protein
MIKKAEFNSLVGTVLCVCTLASSASVLADGKVYSAYDKNFDGYLDPLEFEFFLKKRRVKSAYQHLWVFDKVDTDDDRLISNQELVDTLQKEIQLRKQKKNK